MNQSRNFGTPSGVAPPPSTLRQALPAPEAAPAGKPRPSPGKSSRLSCHPCPFGSTVPQYRSCKPPAAIEISQRNNPEQQQREAVCENYADAQQPSWNLTGNGHGETVDRQGADERFEPQGPMRRSRHGAEAMDHGDGEQRVQIGRA